MPDVVEILAATAVLAALTLPEWLFRNVSRHPGAAATAALFFTAGFLAAISGTRDDPGRALLYALAFAAVGAAGFYGADKLRRLEAEHPVDLDNLTPRQLWIRRFMVPLFVVALGFIVGGLGLLVFEVITPVFYAVAVAAALVVGGALYAWFVQSSQASRSRGL